MFSEKHVMWLVIILAIMIIAKRRMSSGFGEVAGLLAGAG